MRTPDAQPLWPTYDQLEHLWRHWERLHPERLTVTTVGRSRAGRRLYLLELTDHGEPHEDKQHVVLSALHTGVERSAAVGLLRTVEWLLSDDPTAREILQRQVIAALPVPNPDDYLAGRHGGVYTDWDLDGPRDAGGLPEAAVVQQVFDRYRPEVHADFHGHSLGFPGYQMVENSGASYSNLALRPFHPEIVAQMNAAALALGYPSDHQESDAQRLFWGPDLERLSERLWVGRPHAYAALYAYRHYHTMLLASEVGYSESALARHRRLLEIGNEVWPGEPDAGYPVNTIASNVYHQLVAVGATADERRRSRVELWSKLRQLSIGMIDPNLEGKSVFVCSTNPERTRQLLIDRPVLEFIAALAELPGFDADYLRCFLADWPAGQNREVPYLAVYPPVHDVQPEPLTHGLGLRLRIPSATAKLCEVRLNGRPVPYRSWVARGYTYLQVELTPARLAEGDLFVVTCESEPGLVRESWRGWEDVV